MNEQIREIIEQSKCLSDGYNTGVVDLEKFAQLIVQKCASIVYQTCRDGDAGAQAILYEFDIDNARSQK